jgi:tetratricopeptide (TPR) repeat protein
MPRAAPPVAQTGIARDYAATLARIDRRIAEGKAQTAAADDQWLPHEILARSYLDRARLTGSYSDYAAAQTTLERAMQVAVPGSGPHLLRARLDFNMHRLDAAERQVAQIDRYAVPPDRGERADVAAMRGDIAFYRGDVQAALGFYNQSDQLAPATATFRRAIHAFLTGKFDEAERLFDRSERNQIAPSPQDRAHYEMQRGILDLERGRLDEALVHFGQADRIFPGHWLIEEHIAEVTTLKGNLQAAERMYRDIVRRTGHPEFMDALAGIAAQRGDEPARREWTDRAWAAWRIRIAQFPEAAYGHAVDHCIDKGDWPCTLSLAERNHRARPYGDAKVKLAQALLGNGRTADARALIETVLASPWRSADLHKVASDIYAASGDPARAQRQLALAKGINPLV